MFRVLALLGLMAASAWFGSYRSWEPCVAVLSALAALYEAERRYLRDLTPLPPPPRDTTPTDRALLAAFLRDFPDDGPLGYFAGRTSANPFHQARFFALEEAAQRWSSVEREFLNQNLEAAKSRLISGIGTFIHYVAMHTFPVGKDLNGISPDWSESDQLETIEHIASAAQALFEQYQQFVRLSRRVLLPEPGTA